jgi:hypothetical protein
VEIIEQSHKMLLGSKGKRKICKWHAFRLHSGLMIINPRNLIFSSVIALALAATSARAQTTTQAAGPVNFDGYAWLNPGYTDLASVTFAQGTDQIDALTSTATVVDQGFGGQDPDNGVHLLLVDNGNTLWNEVVAGGTHSLTTDNYDISTDPAGLASLDSALAGINWSTDPNVSLNLEANVWPYPGWALHVQDASFSVTSTVPDGGATITMIGAALAGLAAFRRRYAK